jgi:hypothetical protein
LQFRGSKPDGLLVRHGFVAIEDAALKRAVMFQDICDTCA